MNDGWVCEARIRAIGAACAALVGELRSDTLNWLILTARRDLPDGDYLRAEIETFATGLRPILHQTTEQRPAGERLLHALRVHAAPVVPGADRVDING